MQARNTCTSLSNKIHSHKTPDGSIGASRAGKRRYRDGPRMDTSTRESVSVPYGAGCGDGTQRECTPAPCAAARCAPPRPAARARPPTWQPPAPALPRAGPACPSACILKGLVTVIMMPHAHITAPLSACRRCLAPKCILFVHARQTPTNRMRQSNMQHAAWLAEGIACKPIDVKALKGCLQAYWTAHAR